MLELLYDWLVIDPADLVAALIVMVLVCLPFAAGGGAGWLAYKFTKKQKPRSDRRPQRRQYLAFTVACFVGLYIAFITGVAFTRLPASMFQFLRID
jgi:membrane protease YdiL (CAAX protease family)